MCVSCRLRSKIGLVIIPCWLIPKDMKNGLREHYSIGWQISSMANLSQPSFLWGSAVSSQCISTSSPGSHCPLIRELLRYCRLWTGRDLVPSPRSATLWLSGPGHVTWLWRFSVTPLLDRDDNLLPRVDVRDKMRYIQHRTWIDINYLGGKKQDRYLFNSLF